MLMIRPISKQVSKLLSLLFFLPLCTMIRSVFTWDKFAVEVNIAIMHRCFLRSKLNFETAITDRIDLIGNVTSRMIDTNFQITFARTRCVN